MPESDRQFSALARQPLPTFVTGKSRLRLLRRLHDAGYVEARFFPEARSADQFAQLLAVTPLGRLVLDIVASPPQLWQPTDSHRLER